MHRECRTPLLSADIMKQWCVLQKVNTWQITLNIIKVMDKAHKKQNTLYLNGEPNSDKQN